MCDLLPDKSSQLNTELNSVLCEDLEGWDRGWAGGRLKGQGVHI